MEFVWGLVGYVVGSIATAFIFIAMSRFGKYQIDRRNPEKEIHNLDFGDPLNLAKKKYLVLKIDYNADLSQK